MPQRMSQILTLTNPIIFGSYDDFCTKVGVQGSFTGLQIAFEASHDGITFPFPIGAFRNDSGVSAVETSPITIPDNTARCWMLQWTGSNLIRVRAVTLTSGSPVVQALAREPAGRFEKETLKVAF